MSRALAAAAAAALALASLSTQAAADAKRPDIWQRALDPTRSDAARDVYLRELREGDEHVTQAAMRSSSASAIREQVQRAIDAYRRAAAAQPEAAEPYFRIGMVLWSFYLQSCQHDPRIGHTKSPLADCNAPPDAINAPVAEQTIKAWETFEAKAPLDPRLSSELGGILFSRAIIHTKLATPAHLAAAARDYEAIIQRNDGKGEVLVVTWPNLAETYMMIGRLDDAIDAYKESLRTGARISTWYGLAVALDRDGRGSLARDVIVAQGRPGFQQFQDDIKSQQTFYVPRGEVYYYLALAKEALAMHDEALDHWHMFIASGAHPQFQPRAKEHINAILAKRRAGQLPKPPTDFYRMDLMR
jgi:tetratricopeptide (TPR) repeat protein